MIQLYVIIIHAVYLHICIMYNSSLLQTYNAGLTEEIHYVLTTKHDFSIGITPFPLSTESLINTYVHDVSLLMELVEQKCLHDIA